jgi:hypothetical protein
MVVSSWGAARSVSGAAVLRENGYGARVPMANRGTHHTPNVPGGETWGSPLVNGSPRNAAHGRRHEALRLQALFEPEQPRAGVHVRDTERLANVVKGGQERLLIMELS